MYTYENHVELKVIRDAIRRYANHRPLDLLSPRAIRRDLLSISGDRHDYDASIDGLCVLCGRGKDHEVHEREAGGKSHPESRTGETATRPLVRS